jgi:hypothetical protein
VPRRCCIASTSTKSCCCQVLKVETVYDLATSTLFGNAANVYRAAAELAQKPSAAAETLYGKLNRVPYHLLVRSRLHAAELAELHNSENIASAGTPSFSNLIGLQLSSAHPAS